MKLRNIDILGFKSFRERTSVDLSDGMTAIVGPNGCGKSNVVDALKWAMGDMSAKSLRGQNMEDLIFAGSETRRPMGMAEVTVTFENDGNWGEEIDWGDAVPREFRQLAEIAVTRRLHRSGESEYLINKTPCRLLDIQNLLAGTGIGKQGYSIIEQNRVGFIVSAKPKERRFLIEEASGITRYKGQRDRSERKLERTEENLVRIDDVLAEVDKQIRTLERQARKAAQHRALLEELRALEVALLVARRDELASERELVVESKEGSDAEVDLAKHTIARHAEGLERVKIEAFASEKKHADATESFYRLDTRLNVARSRVEHATVGLQDTNRRLGAAEREAEGQTRRIEELGQDLAELQTQLEALSDLGDREVALREQEAKLLETQAAAETVRRRRQDARRLLEDSRAAIARCDDRAQFFERRRTELDMRESALQTAVDQATQECEKHRISLEGMRVAVDDLRERLGASAERERAFAAAKEAGEHARAAAEQTLAQSSAKRADVETRAAALRGVLARGDGFSDALQRVLEVAGGREDMHGTLADFLRVGADAEHATANLLEGRLLDVLVDDLGVAHDVLEQLGELDGRVSFQSLEGSAPADLARRVEAMLSDPEVVRSGNWTDGRVELTAGRLIAGTASTQARLEQRRHLTELEDEVAQCQLAVERDQTAFDDAVHLWRQTHQKADLARRETESITLELRSREQELAIEERHLERIERSLGAARAEIVPIVRSRTELTDEREANEQRLVLAREQFAGSQAELGQIGDTDDELRADVERMRASVTDAKVAFAEARERQRSVIAARERAESGLEGAKVLLAKYAAEKTQMSQRIVELQETIAAGEAELNGAEEQRDLAKKTADEMRARLDTANKDVATVEVKIREGRAAIERLVEARQQFEFRARELSMSMAHIDEQLRDRYELEVDAARLVVTEIDTSPAERRGKRDYLKRRIESLGPVNAMAEEEYASAMERSEFLTSQKEDLESAIADLRQVIARMDRESRRRFEETFDALNAKFQQIFPELFLGGKAHLRLTDPDDMLNTGVEIVVQPPGKRLQSMSLLSGGEKALTAVSLIFSIFLLKPTPFSILDEVDAPLDEANVGRFARMVKRLSGTSQMIVITHSRRTMESADVLYGVTMEEPGVSKMVNVRLSELDDQLAS